MHCRPKVMAPIIHPTKKCCVNTYSETIVPHIHPQHTTIVNHEHYKHQHYFPQSTSVVNEVTNQHFASLGPAPFPRPRPGFGGFGGPGGPGVFPGYGPFGR
ncbi:CotD family spore coat protein [Metabacillus fastidiosus]|uniref:CotD family spore coat protein n=1 Tax=Metabacillus fastidiosus TaxID=1458 RepID=UPI000826184A|nr:CotD family spore coat protein [Metabacillus fastidiosus]MED4453766.1 CotD family spore coat protein [Metabacillus fastidiosus]MED4462830.1 CotD family spore coat protein [Metabacillus fastidiosus]